MSDDDARAARAWLMAVCDGLRNASATAHRASEVYNGTELATVFHDLGIAIGQYAHTGDEVLAARQVAFAPLLKEHTAKKGRP